MALANISAVDIKAHRLARRWGYAPSTASHRTVRPCRRAHCGGSIMAMADGSRCLLCARENGSNGKLPDAEIETLMTAPPGAFQSLRATPADEADGPLDL